MGLFRIAAASALGYVAYQAWQRRSSAAAALDNDAADTSERPLVTNVSDDADRASSAESTSPGTSTH